MAEQGYGTDVYCWDRLRTGRLVRGPELVAQAIYRRLTTPRGTLRDGDDGQVYGLDVSDFVGRVGAKDAVAMIPAVIRAEVIKDDRVENVAVTSTAVTDKAGLVAVTVTITCDLINPGDQFQLTLSVSAVSVSVLGFSEAAQ